MSADIPTTEPTSLRAGDTWAWRREDLSDYPASGWTLVYYFRNATAYFDITASADGDAYAVSVAKASTGKTPGWYDWVAVVTDTGNTERYEVDRGRVEILANYAAAAVLVQDYPAPGLDESQVYYRNDAGALIAAARSFVNSVL